MQSSNLGYRVWALSMYLMTTGIKGAASMKLHRDLGITQKTAWHLAHRLRESWDKKKAKFEGPVEVDETFIGGKEKNKHAKKKKHPGGGYSGKAVVAGVKDHATGQVHAEVIADTTAAELQGFVYRNVKVGSKVNTDEAKGYLGMTGYSHKYVKHAVGEYVNEEGATTNSIESIWALVKRGYHGTYHQMRVCNKFCVTGNSLYLAHKEEVLWPETRSPQVRSTVFWMSSWKTGWTPRTCSAKTACSSA